MNKKILADVGTVVSLEVEEDGSKRLIIYDKEGYVADIIEDCDINLPFRGKVLIVDGSIILFKAGVSSLGLRYLVSSAGYSGYSDVDTTSDRWIHACSVARS